MPTKIEWVKNPDGSQGETWNPVTGCTKVSEGCRYCYAERVHNRFSDEPFSAVILHEDRLDQPRRWRKPRTIFVCSMSDLFHENVPYNFVDKVSGVTAMNPQHTFIVLTKRPERMKKYYETLTCIRTGEWRIAKNGDLIWWGGFREEAEVQP